jgi:predicted nucleic acid-binding protein
MHGDMLYLLDTNVIISILADKTPLSLPMRFDPPIALSVITEIELLSFDLLSEKEDYAIRSFLAAADITYLNPHIKDITIQLRRKHGIKTPDAIIAATALHRKAVLVTEDRTLLRLKEIPAITMARFSAIFM